MSRTSQNMKNAHNQKIKNKENKNKEKDPTK
jgi:hypothetical protein